MPTHKQSITRLSVRELSDATGLCHSAIRRRLDGLEPIERIGNTPIYFAADALAAIYGRGDQQALNAERTRLAKAQANKIELTTAVRRGDFVASSTAVEAWGERFSNARARLLQLPTKLAPFVVNELDLSVIEERIRTGTEQALAELEQEPHYGN